MQRKTKLVVALVSVLIVSTAFAFMFLDFRAATSETSVDSQVETYRFMEPEIDFASELYVFLEG